MKINHCNEEDYCRKKYKKEAIELLKFSFGRLSVDCIRRVFQSSEYEFTSTYRLLQTIMAIAQHFSAEEDIELMHARIVSEAPCLQLESISIVRKKERKANLPSISDHHLLKELKAIFEFQNFVNSKQTAPSTIEVSKVKPNEKKQTLIHNETPSVPLIRIENLPPKKIAALPGTTPTSFNKKAHPAQTAPSTKAKCGDPTAKSLFLKTEPKCMKDDVATCETPRTDGRQENPESKTSKVARMPSPEKDNTPGESEITCECCFGDYSFEDMVACIEGKHLFCEGCVKEYVREQLYGKNRCDFRCMSSDGCSAGYSTLMFEKALSPRLLRNVEKHCYRAEVTKSKIDGLWACPKCAFLAEVADVLMFVKCPNSTCQHKSCRLCGEKPHENLTCEQAAKLEKEKASAHAQIAEAMTEAVMRRCPGCSTNIVIDGGCNKMTCPCGTLFCCVCRKKIAGYDHFCRTPHCMHETCGKCKLFSNTQEDDQRARREAGMKEEEAIGEAAKNLGLLSPQQKEKTNERRNVTQRPAVTPRNMPITNAPAQQQAPARPVRDQRNNMAPQPQKNQLRPV